MTEATSSTDLKQAETSAGFDKARAAGILYNTGTVGQFLAAGANYNPLALAGAASFVAGNCVLIKWGSHKNAHRAANILFSNGMFCLYMAGVTNASSFGLFTAGHASALGLSYLENENKPQNEKTFVDKLAENRTVIAGSLSLASRLPFLAFTYSKMAESYGDKSFAGNTLMFAAVSLWAVADICLTLAKPNKSAEAAR
jgi:hypothetical protein